MEIRVRIPFGIDRRSAERHTQSGQTHVVHDTVVVRRRDIGVAGVAVSVAIAVVLVQVGRQDAVVDIVDDRVIVAFEPDLVERPQHEAKPAQAARVAHSLLAAAQQAVAQLVAEPLDDTLALPLTPVTRSGVTSMTPTPLPASGANRVTSQAGSSNSQQCRGGSGARHDMRCYVIVVVSATLWR